MVMFSKAIRDACYIIFANGNRSSDDNFCRVSLWCFSHDNSFPVNCEVLLSHHYNSKWKKMIYNGMLFYIYVLYIFFIGKPKIYLVDCEEQLNINETYPAMLPVLT